MGPSRVSLRRVDHERSRGLRPAFPTFRRVDPCRLDTSSRGARGSAPLDGNEEIDTCRSWRTSVKTVYKRCTRLRAAVARAPGVVAHLRRAHL